MTPGAYPSGLAMALTQIGRFGLRREGCQQARLLPPFSGIRYPSFGSLANQALDLLKAVIEPHRDIAGQAANTQADSGRHRTSIVR
jgi:hypothetical protein